MTAIYDAPQVETFLRKKLVGAQLDSFQVYSLLLNIDFLAASDVGLQSCWLSTLGDVWVSRNSANYRERSDVLVQLYQAIGQKVRDVTVEENGGLRIHFGKWFLAVELNKVNFETVWALTPNSPDPTANHEWRVALTDEAELIGSLPG